MKDNKQYNKRSLLTANFSTVLSIALVLFMVASMVLISFHLWALSSQVKEEVAFTVYMSDDATAEQGKELTKELRKNDLVKTADYVSKEDAAKMMDKVMGAGHLDALDGFNPYQASIQVNLKAENFTVKQIKSFITTLEAKETVDAVDYRDDLINDINSVYYNASVFFVIILIALLIISVTLINHTINLTIRNKKLLIRSMQLVGAKASFIRRPFLVKGLWLGVCSGVIADLFAVAVMIWIGSSMEGFDFSPFYSFYLIAAIGIIVLGILLTLLFSYIAVIRNMNLKNYKLYN
ncbi:MAG: permease-like cell division protein FtsX [Bacteroidales bacterium]|nr:permease-like cell division protein FtsX [Bacteroidales bacterium]